MHACQVVCSVHVRLIPFPWSLPSCWLLVIIHNKSKSHIDLVFQRSVRHAGCFTDQKRSDSNVSPKARFLLDGILHDELDAFETLKDACRSEDDPQGVSARSACDPRGSILLGRNTAHHAVDHAMAFGRLVFKVTMPDIEKFTARCPYIIQCGRNTVLFIEMGRLQSKIYLEGS